MPWTFSSIHNDSVLVSRIDGALTKSTLMDYYQLYLKAGYVDKYKKEIVDGRGITKLFFTARDQQQFIDLISQQTEKLRGRQVAMVAAKDVVFGMFRMFEMQREDLDYEIRVFKDYDEAVTWLTSA